MNRKPKIGLLPLYLALYDEARPETRRGFEPFVAAIVKGFEDAGVEVALAGVCRIEPEFRQAVVQFDQADVDLIVTLHLAYSPSLESVDVLAATKRPILMLDTTMDHSFGQDVDPERIMYNHGIHGVQDLASMLRRRAKPFEIVVGHVAESDVLLRAAHIAKAAHAARLLGRTRALRIGPAFVGMGDFSVEEDVLQSVLGISVTEVDIDDLACHVEQVTEKDIAAEMASDRKLFSVEAPENAHARSVRVGLGVRRLLDEGGYDAFSMNFAAFNSADGPVDTVPFLEASKAMARGIGYAGEGDVLTASLVGALQRAFGKTTFTEIFCPDWKGGALFLSHMGEINPDVAADSPRLIEKDYPWSDAQNPAFVACAPAPGLAVLVNLAPGPDDTFTIIPAAVEVLGDTTNPALRDSVRGWIRPEGGVEAFLEAYSMLGGTHHSALTLGVDAPSICAMAAFANIECAVPCK